MNASAVTATQPGTCPVRPYARGFTLVELLVAVAVLSLLMTASLGSVHVASRSLEVSHARAERTQRLRSTAAFLKRQFSQLVPATVGRGAEERLLFTGEPHRVRFAAPGPQYGYGAGLMVYTLEGRRAGDVVSLVLGYSPLDPGGAEPDRLRTGQEVMLTGSLDSLTFEYFGSPSPRDRPAWTRQWPADAENHPTMIRLLTGTTPGARGWPDLVYRIRPGTRR